MKFEIKIFEYKGIPVYFKLWFLLLFAWVSPTIVACLFFAVLLHEMGHAWAADRLGYRVDHIAVDLFYGYADVDMSNCPESDSIKIVAAGPMVNLLLFGVSMFLLGTFPGIPFASSFALVNLMLFIFNILPIYPMDGGRLMKSILMLRMRSRLAAKKAAGWISLITTAALLAYAISTASIMLAIFCLLLGYYALKEIEYVK